MQETTAQEKYHANAQPFNNLTTLVGYRHQVYSCSQMQRSALQRERQIILLTGGAGFIGGNFVLDAVGSGDFEVINLDALTYAGNPDTLAPVSENSNHIFVHGRIGDRELVDRLLADHRPWAIVNFAAEP